MIKVIRFWYIVSKVYWNIIAIEDITESSQIIKTFKKNFRDEMHHEKYHLFINRICQLDALVGHLCIITPTWLFSRAVVVDASYNKKTYLIAQILHSLFDLGSRLIHKHLRWKVFCDEVETFQENLKPQNQCHTFKEAINGLIGWHDDETQEYYRIITKLKNPAELCELMLLKSLILEGQTIYDPNETK